MATTQTFTLPEEVTSARKRAEELTGGATELAAGENTISDILTQKVRDAYSSDQDITSKLDLATGTYLSAPSAAREQYQGIFNPFQRESLVDKYVSEALIPLLSYSTLYGQRQGRIGDIISAGTGAYKAESTRKAGEAKAASDLYTNLFNEWLQTEQLKISAQKAGESEIDLMDIIKAYKTLRGQEEDEWEDITNQLTPQYGFTPGTSTLDLEKARTSGGLSF
jgi:predicted house-cleaning noncanonical NTP pyrophosphatase (MazG superfamily)